jgi:hypothetical protein
VSGRYRGKDKERQTVESIELSCNTKWRLDLAKGSEPESLIAFTAGVARAEGWASGNPPLFGA